MDGAVMDDGRQHQLRGGLKDPEGGGKKRYAPESTGDEAPASTFRALSPKTPKTSTAAAAVSKEEEKKRFMDGTLGAAGGTIWENPTWESSPRPDAPGTPPAVAAPDQEGAEAAQGFSQAPVSPMVQAAVARSNQAKARINRAEERYRQAVERLRTASAASAVAKNVQDTSVASSLNINNNRNAGAIGTETAAAAAAATTKGAEDDTSSDRKTMQEMAAKVEAALARSQLAQERIHQAAREAVKEAREAAAKVREDWSKASSSRISGSWRSREGSMRSDSDWGGSRRGGGNRTGFIDAKKWATVDEVKGKTDMFDRFMGSLSAIDINNDNGDARSAHDGESIGGDGGGHNKDSTKNGDGGGGLSEYDDDVLSDISASPDKRKESTMDTAVAGETATATGTVSHSGTMYGALSVTLVGEAREGEKLTLEVDTSLLPSESGPVHVRWQRGSKVATTAARGVTRTGAAAAAAAGRWGDAVGALIDDGYSMTFKTILGARSETYTLTRSDVGCVIRAIGAVDSPSSSTSPSGAAAGPGGAKSRHGNVFGAAQTEHAVVPR